MSGKDVPAHKKASECSASALHSRMVSNSRPGRPPPRGASEEAQGEPQGVSRGRRAGGLAGGGGSDTDLTVMKPAARC